MAAAIAAMVHPTNSNPKQKNSRMKKRAREETFKPRVYAYLKRREWQKKWHRPLAAIASHRSQFRNRDRYLKPWCEDFGGFASWERLFPKGLKPTGSLHLLLHAKFDQDTLDFWREQHHHLCSYGSYHIKPFTTSRRGDKKKYFERENEENGSRASSSSSSYYVKIYWFPLVALLHLLARRSGGGPTCGGESASSFF